MTMSCKGTSRSRIRNRPRGSTTSTLRDNYPRRVRSSHHGRRHAPPENQKNRRTLHDVRARDRSGREYAQARNLNEAAAAAIDEALRLVATLGPEPFIDAGIDVAFASAGDAVFARKRLNEALAVRELLDDVEAWVWESQRHVSAPLTDAGRANGFELRIRRRSAG